MSSPEHKSANQICADLHRAYRAVRFYPPDHPTARESLGRLVEALAAHTDTEGSLTLDVEEGRLLYEGEPVYSYETTRDNVAFLMFRDGIRSLSFHPGLVEEEVKAFVDCLAHADDLVGSEQDLATSLWERDLVHLDYRVVDPFLGGEVLREGTLDALRETVLRRLREVSVNDQSEADRVRDHLVAVEAFTVDPGSLSLTSAELERSERFADDLLNLLDDFAIVLLEIAGDCSGQATPDDAVTHSLTMLVESYMEASNMSGLDLIFSRLQLLEAQGRCPAGLVHLVASAGVTREGLGRIFTGVAQAPAEKVGRLQAFLGGIRPWVYHAGLELLAETDDRTTRKMLLAVLGSGEALPAEELGPLLEDPRWYVVRNAVQLAAGSPDPTLLDRFERLLTHADVRVRRELIRTLESLGGEPVLSLLTKALLDEDSSVRVLAAGSLGRLGDPAREALLLSEIEGRGFDARPPEEIEAFLVAYANLAKERALPTLNGIWKRKRFFARSTAVRLGALRALGAVPGSAAQAALADAAKSGDAQVRAAATRALYEAQARRSERSS